MFRHYDDETLFQYVEGSSPIGEEIDAHASGCTLCAAEIASHRETIRLLEDEEVWNERPAPPVPPARLSEVAAFASRLKQEDADAVTICDEVLTGPAAWWPTRLRKNPAARTAGVVRELIARVGQILERSPNDALQVTTLATETAAGLSITDYPSDTVITLRAQALREHAFVLSIIGRYPEALSTTDRAEMLFRQTPIPQYEIARLQLVKSNIFRCLDRFDEAIELASASAETFLRFGDRKRYLNARLYEAGALVRLQQSQRAIDIYRTIEQEPSIVGTVLHVQILHNMAQCYRDLKRFDLAVEYLTRCTAEFDLLELDAYAAKTRWLLGTTRVAAGRPADAVPVLRQAWNEHEAHGLVADAALAALDLAEALLIVGNAGEVPAICRTLLDRFTRAGMTSSAITALAFLRETVAIGQVTPSHVRHVHDFLRELPGRPAHLFAPPPVGTLEG